MNRKIIKALSLVILAISSVSATHAATLYVAPSGTSGGSCTDSGTPCTLARALQGGVSLSGDELLLAEGTYTLAASPTIIDKSLKLFGGYNTDFSAANADASKTVIRSNGAQVFELNNNHSNFIEFKAISFESTAVAVSGAIRTTGNGALLRLNNVRFINTNASAASGASAINMTVAGDKLEIAKIEVDAFKSASGAAIKMTTGTSLTVTDGRFSNNEASAGNGGAIELAAGMTLVSLNDVAFVDNKALSAGADGGAIYAASNATLAPTNIKLANFINNSANDNGGAIAFLGSVGASTSVTVESATFSANSAARGGAIYYGDHGINANQSKLRVVNATFSDNTATSQGAAVVLKNGGMSEFYYNTFYGNNGGTAAIYQDGVPASATATLANFLGNLLLEPNIDNLFSTNAGVGDYGHNIVGFNGNAKSTSLPAVATSSTYGQAVTDIIETQLKANGGKHKTFKLVKSDTSPAIDKVDNDAIPYFGVGTSATYPFTSLAQAHGALKSYANYTAGTYYFDLEGSYSRSGETWSFNASGNTNAVFSSYVDEGGWVLIASSNKNNTAGNYVDAPSNNVQLGADHILSSSVIANTNFIFDEVRLSTEDGASDALDIRSSKFQVLTDIKTFKRLHSDGDWFAYAGATHLGSCATYSAADLNAVIFDACDNANGVKWNPAAGIEQQDASTASPTNKLNLWVRGQGLCNGAITTIDNRGLPRADYLNPYDSSQASEIHHCDIGAFEFNNGYRVDCYDEDGLRPQNYYDIDLAGNTASATYQVCYGGDILNTNPKALINNALGSGSFHHFYSCLLVLLLAFRFRSSHI